MRTTRFYKIVIGTTPVQIVPYVKERLALLIRHHIGEKVFVSNDAVEIVDKGFPLMVGDTFSLLAVDGDCPDLALYAVTTVGTAELRIVESYGTL